MSNFAELLVHICTMPVGPGPVYRDSNRNVTLVRYTNTLTYVLIYLLTTTIQYSTDCRCLQVTFMCHVFTLWSMQKKVYCYCVHNEFRLGLLATSTNASTLELDVVMLTISQLHLQ